MLEWFNHEKQIDQLKLAFDSPQFCPFCEEQIDLNNPPIRLLVSMRRNEVYCSRWCYEEKHHHGSEFKENSE